MKSTKKYLLSGTIDEVKKVLINLEVYGKAHPLIQSVQKIRNDKNEFRIKEKPYSWIPVKVCYTALVFATGNHVEYIIKGLPFTKTKIEYLLTPMQSQGTQVEFILKIENKIFAGKFLANKMLNAQDQLMKTINSGFIN